MTPFARQIAQVHEDALRARSLTTLQVNVGLTCELSCSHCHLACGPSRHESMDWPVMELVVRAADAARPSLVDITGGSPELNPHLRRFVSELAASGWRVQLRTNLVALDHPARDGLVEMLAAAGVRLIGSLPSLDDGAVHRQRGAAVLERSVRVLGRLNAAGYGVRGGPELYLMHNPQGTSLPACPADIENAFRRELSDRFGVGFTRLLVLANMPLGRFRSELSAKGTLDEYLATLRDTFNPATVEGLMCRDQVEVAWDGTLYDCDFNLAAGLPVDATAPRHVSDFDADALSRRPISYAAHCWGCTAQAGSS